MFRFLVFCVVCACHIHAELFDSFHSLSPKAQRAQEMLKEIEPLIEQSLEDYQVPGLAVGFIVDGELVYAKGFGVRDIEKKLPVTSNTIFSIGSCTKAFTAFLTGIYVDRGWIGWDTPLVEVIPDFRLWDCQSTYQMTFRDLLTHRSGLPRHDFVWYNAKMTRSELMEKLRYLEPVCPLGQRYIYNHLMYLPIGVALEKLSGDTWEEMVSEEILKPLGMDSTNFSVHAMEQSSDYALPYIEKHHKLKKMTFRDISVTGPGGAINSNIEDLAVWLKMHLAQGIYKGINLIQSSTLQEMLVPQIITTGAPEAQDTAFSSYGLGWGMLSYRGHYLISHDGGVDGFTSVVGLLPQEKIGIIVLANKNLTLLPRLISMQALDKLLGLPFVNWLQDGLVGLNKSKETAQENKSDPNQKKETAPSHSLEEFVGEYEHPAYGRLFVDTVEGRLRVIYHDVPFVLKHWHYDVFAVEEEPETAILSIEGLKFAFRNDVNGEIAELVVPFEPNVEEIVFRKKPTESHWSPAYLRQFTGLYEIYGYTIDISVRGNILQAAIPGQPIYELIPSGLNEFTVKSKIGYLVRFVFDEDEKATEILLMQPYGTFTATRK
jgi:CubicO group peptidase (beta-lactamase class C family)